MGKADPDKAWINGCQCALHDDGYRVVLPRLGASHGGRNSDANANADAKVGAEAEVGDKISTSRWLRFFTRKQDREEKEEEDLGSVERCVEEHVQAAMDRKEEWLLDKVRVLKRAGLDDEGVLQAWERRPWAQFGFVALPDGWKDL